MNKKDCLEMDVNHGIAKAAIDWVVKLEGKNNRKSDERKFMDWIKESPVHIREFFELREIWNAFDSIQQMDKNTLSELLKDDIGCENVVNLHLDRVPGASINRGKSSSKWPSHLKAFSMAAVLCVISIISVLVLQYPRVVDASIYSTRLGEQRSFTLEDGSVLYLNTQSSIKVIFSERQRSVKLTAGEAHFNVAYDKNRVFIVSTDNAVIKSVGTAFNVYHPRNGDTIVTVVEGKIKVAASLPRLDAREEIKVLEVAKVVPAKEYTMAVGWQATIKSVGEIMTRKVSKGDMDVATAWRQRQLVFKSHPLSKVADEFNRYNRLEIIVDSESTGKQEITGIFAADKPTSLIKFLESDASLKVTKLYDKIFISVK